MKTLKKANEVARFSEDKVDAAIKKGWGFCPKSEYKKIRDAEKKKPAEKDAK